MTDILERHGINGAVKVSATSTEKQSVTVDDDQCSVLLGLSACSYPVALTPEQARMVAKFLNAAATRVEKRAKP